jgi:hypothetical protein
VEKMVWQLPGSRPTRPAGTTDYLVLLEEDEDVDSGHAKDEPAVQSRGDLYSSGVARTRDFQFALRRWLDEQGLAEQVVSMGEPTVFPIVSITATPAAAKLIERFPGVAGVLRDNPDEDLTDESAPRKASSRA